MRVVVLAFAALALAAVVVQAVPSHHVESQHVLQERGNEGDARDVRTTVQLHDQCLKEISKHLRDWELPFFGASMFAKDSVVAKAEHLHEARWPNNDQVRAVCKKNADWMFALFKPAKGSTKHTYTVESGKGDTELDTNWLNNALWENSHGHPFTTDGRVCYMELFDGKPGSPMMHQWIVEATTSTTLRHYQSFVGCYTLNDWLHEGPAPLEGTSYSSGCDFIAARKSHGGGQLLTKDTSEANAYGKWLQDVLGAIKSGGAMSSVRAQYKSLFGVDISSSHVWQTPKFTMTCTPRVPLACAAQERAVHVELSRFRRALRALPAIGPNDDKFTNFYPLYNAFSAWELGQLHATKKGWAKAAQSIKASRITYNRFVTGMAAKYCGSGEHEYRVVLRDNKEFLALKNAKDIKNNQLSVAVSAALQGNLISRRMAGRTKQTAAIVVTCATDATTQMWDDWGVAAKYRSACQDFRIVVNGKTPATSRIKGMTTWAAARWELQLCVDKSSGAVPKQRWIPSIGILNPTVV